MIILLICIIVTLSLCGIYGPRHDKLVEEEKERKRKHREEFEKVMRETDESIEMINQICKDMEELNQITNEEIRFAKEHGFCIEELLKQLDEEA